MGAPEQQQLEINFQLEPAADGFEKWRQQRRTAMKRLARQTGLPLDHAVEVWLRGNVRLRGVLRLEEQVLFADDKPDRVLRLVVDNVSFTADEIESCVRTD